MDIYREEDFYKENGGPTEYLKFCPYIFYQETTSQWGRDYDQFALVTNAEYPYIRLTKKIADCHYPSGGSSSIIENGSFASLTEEERDNKCPKIAWGVAAYFLSQLKYDEGQDDYVLYNNSANLCKDYYEQYLHKYMSCHNALKYAGISNEQKELDFITEHLPIIKLYWEKSKPLKRYNILYNYAQSFESEYEAYVNSRKQDLEISVMASNKFGTKIERVFETDYVKVFFLDDSVATDAKQHLDGINCIRKVNITQSKSADHPGATLTVYPKTMVNVKDCEKEIRVELIRMFANVAVGNMKPRNDAHFKQIEKKILAALDKALASIDVCVAWFTNDKFKDKLLEKQDEGVAIRVITFKDGVNKRYGVDLTGIPHKEFRAERGGIMHEKFCVIDNVITINGSYNWTPNAENKNDEDAAFHIEDYKFASQFTKRFNEIWKRDENTDVIEINKK